MLVSLRWLKDYVDFHLSPAELVDRLTMSGLEVESFHETGPAFSNVVAAKILSVKTHPNADKCFLCDVTTGDATYPIVCGASNINCGDMVPLAKLGATIPGGYTIKSSMIRGELSEGMLCSEQELGVGDDADGIMILSKDISPGRDLADILDLKDTVFDVGITPNRSDCLSIIGIAREVAAITGGTVRYPVIVVKENEEDTHRITSVDILDPDLCPRYSARIIRNVKIGSSPLWMRQRLEAVGLRAINNIVDITNFVMIELGQPLHAFDFRYLEEGRIVVRRSLDGERFTSLDEKERILRPDTLMICDGVKPVAIAGIMGGLNSEVKDDTETILLESAYFNPSSIRISAKWLGMNTDAAFRFGRGVDPEGVIRASDRAAQLMAEMAGGTIFRGCIDQYPMTVQTAKNIPLRVKRVKDILGTDINADDVVNILKSLEMDVCEEGEGKYSVTPPTYRVDMTREIDLIEEVARLYGYDRIPVTLPDVSVAPASGDGKLIFEERIRGLLKGSGYSEVITFSFITPESVDILGLNENDERRNLVRIRNPLTEDQSVMRSTLVYGLLETMKNNSRAGNINLSVFETGRIFIHRGDGELPVEKNKLAGLLTGSRCDDLCIGGGFKMDPVMIADFYDLKGCIENVLDGIRISDVQFRSGHEEPFLHPGKSCGIYAGDEFLGFIGEIHPHVLAKMDLKSTAVAFEMDMDVLAALFSGKIMYRALPKFPSITRDVAFLVKWEMEAEEMLRLAMSASKELLEKVSIFDVYCGKSIPQGMKSLGLRFSYRASDRTLTDDEVNDVHSAIVKEMVDITGAIIRGEES
jgi:phenylalanyl-tRNA synthetase beta chain